MKHAISLSCQSNTSGVGTGGVGGAVVEALSEVRNVAIRVHGVRGYGESGLGHELYAKHGLDASGIARVARDFVRSDAGR